MAAAADQSPNPLVQVVTQYKQGYKTSEFWVALAAGVAQALILAFDPSKPIKGQITNLTWIALAYILGRSGLKVAQAATQAKTVTALAAAGAAGAPAVDNSTPAAQPQKAMQSAAVQPLAVQPLPVQQLAPTQVVAAQPEPMPRLAPAQPPTSAPESMPVEGNGLAEWIAQLRILIDLRDRGEITPEEFAEKRAQLPQ
jgi:hypothetical protein